MNIAAIRTRLQGHVPTGIEEQGLARAAVALVLRDTDAGAEFIVIHRAHRKGDPWSGHMALPGGRQQASDAHLFATAARETCEEVGIDLSRGGELLGHLDDLRAVGRGRLLDLVIRPFVCGMAEPSPLRPNQAEVQSAFWIPLASLRRRDVRSTYRHSIMGREMEHPAFLYEGHTIWGLTHRILSGFLEILD